MAAPTLLVTGAAGFTGRHLVAAAGQRGYRCVALCQGPGEEVVGAESHQVADLLDRDVLVGVIRECRPQYIVHLAGVAFVAHGEAAELYEANLVGTVNLLEAAREAGGVEKMILASSANLYGQSASLPLTEGSPVRPANHYGVSKAAMEQAAGLFEDLPVMIVRPFNYTGRGQSERFLIPKLVAAFRSRAPHIALGNLDVARDFSDVRDVVDAYLGLLEKGENGATYNISSGRGTALETVVAMLEDLAGYRIEVSVNPDLVREDEIRELYGSPARLEAAIGDYRRHTLRDTLEWMLAEDYKAAG